MKKLMYVNMNVEDITKKLVAMRQEELVRALVDKACSNIAQDYVNSLDEVAVIEGKLMVRLPDLSDWVRDNHFVFKSRENKEKHWRYLHLLVYNCLFFTSYIKHKIMGVGDQAHVRILDNGKGPTYYADRYKIKQKDYFKVCPEFLAEMGNCKELTEPGTYAIYMFGSLDKKNNKNKTEKYAVIVGSLVVSVSPTGVVMYSTFDNKPEINIMPYKNPEEFWYYLFAILSDSVNGPAAYARLMYTASRYEELEKTGQYQPFDHVILMRYCKLSSDPFPLSWMQSIAELYGIL